MKLNQRIKYEIEKNSDLLKGNIIAFKDNDFETPLLDQLYSEALDLLFPFFVFKDAYDAVQKSNESLTKQRIHLNNMKLITSMNTIFSLQSWWRLNLCWKLTATKQVMILSNTWQRTFAWKTY